MSEERYARAIEATEAGHWEWDLRTNDVYHSARFRELHGIPAEEQFAGRDEWKARQHYLPGERERQEKAIRGAIEGPVHRYEIDVRIAPRPGEIRWLRSRGKLFRDEAGRPALMAGTSIDVTGYKLAEEELRKQRAYLDQLFELAPVAIILNTLEPRTLRVNKEFTRMFGYAADEVVGKRIRDLIVPHGVRAVTDDPRWRAGERIEAEIVRRRKDGTLFHAHVTAAQIPLQDAENAGYVIYHDISERKQAEEALRQSERQRRQAQRLEAMGTLSGGIAHDFNNILGAILGYGEMALRDAPQGSRLRRDLESILTAGERGRVLVDRILMFSRSGMGERIPVHVEKVVREALDLLRPRLPEGIAVEARLEAGRAAMLGEPTQVHQVLMNLATNAVQAMPAGGTLRVSLSAQVIDPERVVTIGTVGAGEYIVLEVADSGTGIAPAILDRIFDPFFTTKEVNVGTGLGLSLVHGIVVEVGGAIEVASTPDSGSTFTVYLPRAGDVPDKLEEAEQVLPQGGGQRVMVVDDEESLVRLATETLDELGYAPSGFTSSVAALDAFRADPEAFDAVITDERMPGISGSALIREVRRIRQSIPILLVSGYVGGMVAGRAYNEGADEVLKKPLSAHELATSLARALQTDG